MFGITNTTPSYKGSGQAQPSSGGFFSGVFGYLFGAITPAYKSSGQATTPTSRAGGIVPGTPAYKSPPPVVTQSPPPATVYATAPGDGCSPPDGNPPQVYVCIS